MVHPAFLWALLFLAIPVIVHLFNLRKYKKEYFSNTSLLISILSETQKTSKLKKRLLLASRILAAFFIILAFVQPLFNTKNSGKESGQPIMSIYIDNSFSMESPSGQMKALEEAKQKALELLKSTENQGLYQILTNDFYGNQLQLLTYPEAKEAIKSIKISSSRKSANEVWEKQMKTAGSNSSERKAFYWLSDFQKNQFNKLNQLSDDPLTCIPIIHNKKRNIYIDTAFIYSHVIKTNQDIKIVYRIRKSEDDQSIKSLVTLTINEAIKARKEVVWGNKNSLMDTLTVKIVSKDWQFLKLSISDPSISFDNEYFFTFYLSPKPYISLIGSSADQRFISNALKADDNFDIHSFVDMNLSTEEIGNSNLIVINQLDRLPYVEKMQEWLRVNKNIVLFLPGEINMATYNASLISLGLQSIAEQSQTPVRMKQFNFQDPTLQNIFTQVDQLSDLPNFSSFYNLSGYSQRAKEVLISFDNGVPFLIKYSRLGEGNIYLFTANVASSKSNFVFSSVFAPLMYKLGASASSFQLNSYFIGSANSISIPIEVPSDDKVYKIVGDHINVIPPQRKIGNTLQCQLHESISESGFYGLVGANGQKIYQLALNHKRQESEMNFMNPNEIQNALGYKNLEIDTGNSSYLEKLKAFAGVNLWKLWVILALFFLLVEMAIILFWEKLYTK